MFSPPLTFSLLLGTACGALAHLIVGGGGRLLIAFILAGWVGSAIGQAVGDVMGIQILVVGTINVLTNVLGAWLAVVVVAILFWPRVPQRSRRRPG